MKAPQQVDNEDISGLLYQEPPQPVNQEGTRYPDCPFYDHCLNYAVKQMWSHWSCGKCLNYMLIPIFERLQYIENYYGLVADIYPEFRRKYERFLKSYHRAQGLG